MALSSLNLSTSCHVFTPCTRHSNEALHQCMAMGGASEHASRRMHDHAAVEMFTHVQATHEP